MNQYTYQVQLARWAEGRSVEDTPGLTELAPIVITAPDQRTADQLARNRLHVRKHELTPEQTAGTAALRLSWKGQSIYAIGLRRPGHE